MEPKALENMIVNGDGESPSAIDVRGNMGNALSHLGRYDEAEALLRETLELSVQVDGRLAPNTVIRRSNLGLVLANLERYDEAAEVHQAAIDDGLKVWPQDYRFIEVMRGSLASALRGAGRLDESLVAYREAAAMAERRNGKNNRTYVRRLRGIAAALRDMARYDEAEALVDEGLARAASSSLATRKAARASVPRSTTAQGAPSVRAPASARAALTASARGPSPCTRTVRPVSGAPGGAGAGTRIGRRTRNEGAGMTSKSPSSTKKRSMAKPMTRPRVALPGAPRFPKSPTKAPRCLPWHHETSRWYKIRRYTKRVLPAPP